MNSVNPIKQTLKFDRERNARNMSTASTSEGGGGGGVAAAAAAAGTYTKPATVKELLMAANKARDREPSPPSPKPKRMMVFRPRGVGRNKQNIQFIAPSPRKRLHSGEKQMLLNIFSKLQEEHPNRKKVEIREFMEKLTGVSQKAIEMAEIEYIKGKSKQTGKGKNKPSLSSMVFCPEIKHSKAGKSEEKIKEKGKLTRMKNVDDYVKEAVRKKIHEFLFRNEIPTKRKLNDAIESDKSLPNLTMVMLFRTAKEIGFRYQKIRETTVLTERDEVAVWRRRYIRRIRQYREDGKKIYYADETWVDNVGRCGVSFDGTVSGSDTPTFELARQAFVDSYNAEVKQQPANDRNGIRFIVAHVGSSDGFLEGGLLTFQAKKSSNGYQQMDGSIFEAWFGEILKMLEPNSVLVFDNAPYHCVKTERIPCKGWRKSDIQSWLLSKQIQFTPCMIMSELLDLVNGVKHRYGLYNADKLAREAGHVVLRLPPFYSEFNPIELAWNQIKSHVVRNVHTYEPDEMEKLIHEGINAVTKDHWRSYIEKVKTIEDKYWDLGEAMDKMDYEYVSDGTEVDSSDSSSSSSSSN